MKILKKKFTFKNNFGNKQKIGKPHEIAYSEVKKIVFKNGVSQPFPIFEGNMSHVFGLRRDTNNPQPIVNINSKVKSFDVTADAGLRTVDFNRPHLIHTDKDVDWKDFTLPMDVYKKGIKAQMPDFIKERKDLGKWDIVKNYIRYKKMLDEYVNRISACKISTYLFRDWTISIDNYKEFLDSILIEEVIVNDSEAIPDNYHDCLRMIFRDSGLDARHFYSIHFELKSEFVKINDKGEYYVVDKNGEFNEDLTKFYNELINNLEVSWLRTDVHIVNKANDKLENMWFTALELQSRYVFNNGLDEFVKVISENVNLDEVFNSEFLCSSMTKIIKKYFNINLSMIESNLSMIMTPIIFDNVKQLFEKIVDFDKIKRNCPMVKRLIEYMEAERAREKSIKNGVIKFLNDDTNRWIMYSAFNEIIDYIKSSNTDNLWKDLFIFVTKHINWANLTEILKRYKDFISDGYVQILKYFIDDYKEVLNEDENKVVEKVKEGWKNFPINIESLYFSLFGFKVFRKIMTICGNVFEKYAETMVTKYIETNPFGDKEIPTGSYNWGEFVKEMIYYTNNKLENIVNEYKEIKPESREGTVGSEQ